MDKIFHYLSPLIIYYVVCFLIAMGIIGESFSVMSGARTASEAGKGAVEFLMALYCVCTVIYLLMWMRDRERTGFEGNEMPLKMWLVLPLLGLAFAFANIYSVRGMMRQDVSEAFFGLSSYVVDSIPMLPMLYVAIFVAEPICYEFLFRGLMQMRLREDMGKWSAIVVIVAVTYWISKSITTTIFAVILSFVYEYYRSLAASILVSLSASLGTLAIYLLNDHLPGLGGEMNIAVPIILLVSILACAFFMLMIHRKHESPY